MRKRLSGLVGVMVGLALLCCLGMAFSGCKEAMVGKGGSLPSLVWGEWKPEQKIMEYGREDLSEYLDGSSSHYLSYNFRRLWVRPYHNPAGQTLTAELYDMSSSEDAYGIFSRDRAGEELNIPGAEAIYNQGTLKLRKGSYFLWLISSTQDDRYRDALIALADAVSRQLPSGLPIPSLVQKLPGDGLQNGTIFYFHTKLSLDSKVSLGRQNLLQLSPKTKAVLASYALPEGRANLLVVMYPEGTAAEAFASFRQVYFSKATPREDSEGFFVAETKSGIYEGMALSGNYLAVVLNGDSEKVCRRLLDSVGNIGR
jgi:hypothetical protein